jgi:hypothetical protein
MTKTISDLSEYKECNISQRGKSVEEINLIAKIEELEMINKNYKELNEKLNDKIIESLKYSEKQQLEDNIGKLSNYIKELEIKNSNVFNYVNELNNKNFQYIKKIEILDNTIKELSEYNSNEYSYKSKSIKEINLS